MSDRLMKGFRVLLCVSVALIISPLEGWAQPGPPPDPDVPISGIEFLLGGGALLGVRQLLSRFKSSRKQ